EPTNVSIMVELARIQTYSSASLTTDAERKQRLQEALETITRATELAPDDSDAHAVRAFVLDWNSNPTLVTSDESDGYLADAAQEAQRAYVLDNNNALALAYNAEILVDQKNWLQAEQYIRQAMELNENFMDIHRINGYVMETLGDYGAAITSYKEAAELMPNMTFLYINIGTNYRQLKQYDLALEYYDRAANINKQVGIFDPIPYLAIANTYSQIGEFFIAAQNTRTALEFNPTNANVYGSLGLVYFKSRNYESAIPALQCVVRGCDAKTSCIVRDECTEDTPDDEVDPKIEIQALPLSANTVIYYYTYGSVLAGMHRPVNNYCAEATQVLAEVRAGFSNDPTILSIIEPSEEICRSYGE
ncbi:MAG: tetratricopeptide repeat protein, partial [Anaerolineaceae bacterium]|nr:tetratricopeptide repeat protein [Anaerolineaceae bacterium]